MILYYLAELIRVAKRKKASLIQKKMRKINSVADQICANQKIKLFNIVLLMGLRALYSLNKRRRIINTKRIKRRREVVKEHIY